MRFIVLALIFVTSFLPHQGQAQTKISKAQIASELLKHCSAKDTYGLLSIISDNVKMSKAVANKTYSMFSLSTIRAALKGFDVLENTTATCREKYRQIENSMPKAKSEEELLVILERDFKVSFDKTKNIYTWDGVISCSPKKCKSLAVEQAK